MSDYEVLLRSNSRSYAHERKSKALLDEIHQLESEISRQLNALDAATGGRSGPFDGGEELARVKVSHSKLARDFERIKASHDGNMRRESSTGFGGGVGSSGDAGGSSSTWARDEAPLGSAAAHGNDQQAQLVMQREVSSCRSGLGNWQGSFCSFTAFCLLLTASGLFPFPMMPLGGIQPACNEKSRGGHPTNQSKDEQS